MIEQRYNFKTALYTIGLDTKLKQFLFLMKHRHELNENYIEYGITISQLEDILNKTTELERKLYGIKIKKEK